MTRLSKSALLAVVPVVAIAIGLGGCKAAKSPGEVCSAQDTFDGLLGIMVPSAKTGSPSIADLSKFVTFTLPTVANIDQATKKVDCHAMMTVSGSKGVTIAASAGDISVQTLNKVLPVNDEADDHVSFQIAYSVQPTADGSQTVFELDQADTLSRIVGAAISTMKQESAQLAAAAAQPADAGNAAMEQGTHDILNMMAPPSSASDSDTSDTGANSSTSAGCAANPEGHYCNTNPQADPSQVNGAKAGMPYSQVRKLLLAGGFAPVPRGKDDDCGDATSCTFPETQSCTGAGVELCLSAFKKDGRFVEVDGEGEQDDQPVTAITFSDTRPGG